MRHDTDRSDAQKDRILKKYVVYLFFPGGKEVYPRAISSSVEALLRWKYTVYET
jgi:hypothetical protein